MLLQLRPAEFLVKSLIVVEVDEEALFGSKRFLIQKKYVIKIKTKIMNSVI